MAPRANRVRLFARLWHSMQDLPRHLGQHSGGMVICHGRLDDVVPLENATMPNRVVVQWDKDDCADMGIVKVDLLGLGMLAVIQDSIALVNRHRPSASSAVHCERLIDLAHVPAVSEAPSARQRAPPRAGGQYTRASQPRRRHAHPRLG